MKANTIINKAKFVGSTTAGTVVGLTAKCAIITAGFAAPTILGMALSDKISKGTWCMKKNAAEFLNVAVFVTAAYVGYHTGRNLVSSTMEAITTKEPTAEDFEAEMDDFDRYVAD